MYIGEEKKTKVGKYQGTIRWNGVLYLVSVPSITRQFIGTGHKITDAKNDALRTINKYGWDKKLPPRRIKRRK